MRTEQEILNDFKKLGFDVILNSDYFIYFRRFDCIMRFDKQTKVYACCMHNANDLTISIEFEYYKLLHELFECWGWIE